MENMKQIVFTKKEVQELCLNKFEEGIEMAITKTPGTGRLSY